MIKGLSLKNELNYNRDTWEEWAKTANVTGNSTGIEFISNNMDEQGATIDTKLKGSTKYGILLNVLNNTLVYANLSAYGNLTGSAFAITSKGVAGNQKVVITTQKSITLNSLTIYISPSEPSDNKVKIKDIRLFELPASSQIETDFNTLTADQLAQKYPYINGDSVKSTVSAVRLKSVSEVGDKGSVAYINGNGELRSLPNGVKDEVNVSDGKLYKRVSGKFVLGGSESWTYHTSTNYFRTTFLTPTEINMLPIGSGGTAYSPDIPFVSSLSGSPLLTAFTIGGTYAFFIRIEGITTESALKNYLQANPITLTYQLAEPIVTPIDPQHLAIFPNGTRWIEPGNKQTSIYDNGITIIDTHTPILKLYKLTKVHLENGHWKRTDIDLAKATVASDGLSLTIDGAINSEIYDVEWDYDSSLTTLGELVVSEPETVTRNNRTITL